MSNIVGLIGISSFQNDFCISNPLTLNLELAGEQPYTLETSVGDSDPYLLENSTAASISQGSVLVLSGSLNFDSLSVGSVILIDPSSGGAHRGSATLIPELGMNFISLAVEACMGLLPGSDTGYTTTVVINSTTYVLTTRQFVLSLPTAGSNRAVLSAWFATLPVLQGSEVLIDPGVLGLGYYTNTDLSEIELLGTNIISLKDSTGTGIPYVSRPNPLAPTI
jgi:hypothetical protein